jgi:pilus assembly protein TadC
MFENAHQFFGIGNEKSIEERTLNIFGFIFKVVLALYFLGLINEEPKTVLLINFVLKVLISLYLIYRYNSFFNRNNLQFTNLDRKIVFSLAFYNLIISFFDYIHNETNKLRNFVKSNITDKLIWKN